MAALPVYDKTGAQVGELELPSAFATTPHAVMLRQAIVAELAGRRQGTAGTKTRAEVAGSGRKLWRQKGTGRARVGDRRPPNRVGGGVAAGPRPRSYAQRLAVRHRREALRAALSARADAGDLIILESVELAQAKTKALRGLLDAIGLFEELLLVLPEHSETVWRCGRNLEGLCMTTAAMVSALDLMTARKVILTKDAISRLEARLT